MSYEISTHQDFDKSDASTIKLNVIKQMARELGFGVL